MGIFSKLKSFFQKKWVRIFLLLLLAGFAGMFIWRACNVIELRQKIYVIGRSANLAPLKFEGKEPNVLAFESDILTDIGVKEKLRVHLVTLSDTNLFYSLDRGAYDAIIIPVEPTSLMKERYA